MLLNLNQTKLKLLILVILFILTLLTYKLFESNKIKKIEMNNIIIKLNNCFDFDNKSSRSIDSSLKLVEFCIKKYGKN